MKLVSRPGAFAVRRLPTNVPMSAREKDVAVRQRSLRNAGQADSLVEEKRFGGICSVVKFSTNFGIERGCSGRH